MIGLPLPSPAPPSWLLASSKIASRLLEPTTGDVIFITRDVDDKIRELYAHKSILSANSEYFECRKLNLSSEFMIPGLKPEWREKASNSETSSDTGGLSSSKVFSTTKISQLPSSPSSHEPFNSSTDVSSEIRQVIHMADPEDDIDFVTLHNILYYIYTGTANLHIRHEDDGISFPEGYPAEPDPYRLYRNADRFLLPSLKERCYTHLKHGVTPESVSERLFHKECEHYEELRSLYVEYIIANYDKVKGTVGWKQAVCHDDDDEEFSLSRQISDSIAL